VGQALSDFRAVLVVESFSRYQFDLTLSAEHHEFGQVDRVTRIGVPHPLSGGVDLLGLGDQAIWPDDGLCAGLESS
jgi:hypothetical protein